ncbi:MAG TPA: hypothetical protein VEI03_09270 [Stellaceae bacterium]|nr:hypothetical protein [Stellaceae bacterium]
MSQSNARQKSRFRPPQDARSLARLLIDRFGERAASYAVHQSLKALSRGDQREAARWRWIAEVTRDTLRFDLDDAFDRTP